MNLLPVQREKILEFGWVVFTESQRFTKRKSLTADRCASLHLTSVPFKVTLDGVQAVIENGWSELSTDTEILTNGNVQTLTKLSRLQ